MASSIGTRLAFEKAKEGIKAAGFSLGTAVLSQSYLRTEVAMNTNSTLYQFPVLVNDNFNGLVTSTSRLLNLQDAFYVSQIGVFVAAPSSGTDTTFPLATYPNLSQFTAPQADALNTLYNGFISLIVNNRQILPAWSVDRHYFAPNQQETTDAQYTTSGIDYVDQRDGSNNAYYPVEPGLVLVGSKQNTLQLQLPAALAAVAANSRIIIQFLGHLAQNVTSVR
jgi:hypothetical protein